MSTNKCNSSKSNCKIMFFLHSSIANSSYLSILEISSCKGNYWRNITYCILSPCFKSFRKLLAWNVDIVINTKVNICRALSRDLIAPIHRVVWRFEDVDWSQPWCFVRKYWRLWWLYLTIPNNIKLTSNIAFHWCISINMFLKYIVVSPSCISHSNKCKSL